MSDEKDDKWKMPEPVFRSTSGAVPRNLEETISSSFAPNAEPVEIDPDDDILGIMDSNVSDGSYQQSQNSDDENILETAPLVESAPSVAINVTAKDKIREPKQIDNARADFLTYLAIVVIGAGLLIAAVYYWFWPPMPTR